MSRPNLPRDEDHGANVGWAATSTMFGGLLVWGGLGWLLDHWWGTAFATPIGVVLGLGLGVYAVVLRYGREPIPAVVQRTDPLVGSQLANTER